MKDGDDYQPLPEDHVVLNKSDLDQKYIPVEKHKEGVERAVKSRLSNHVNLDSAHENETVISRVLEKHSPKASTEEERKRWETAHLEPERKRREEIEARATALESRVKLAEMSKVFAEAGFGKGWTTRPAEGKPSPAEIYAADEFELDENASLKVKGLDVDPVEYAKQFATKDAYSIFLDGGSQNRSGTGKPGQDRGGEARKEAVVTQQGLRGAELNAYIEKNGYATPRFDGAVPYKKLKPR